MCYRGRAVEDRPQRNRAEFPHIDTDIELPRLRFQSAMTMAVQIKAALCHAAPCAERVMAEHQ